MKTDHVLEVDTQARELSSDEVYDLVFPEIGPNAWDVAAQTVLRRDFLVGNPLGMRGCPLEPGANFLVLMLEKMGARTIASCEGHPKGFYVMFESPYETAWQVASVFRFGSVFIAGLTQNIWVFELCPKLEKWVDKGDGRKQRLMRHMARLGEETFGRVV